ESVKAFTLTHPPRPKAPTTRPITTRGESAAGALLGRFGGLFLRAAGDFGFATLDELLHCGRWLRAELHPVIDAVERDPEILLGFGSLGVVEADALDEAAIARHARIGDDDVVEGAVLGTTSGHANHYHGQSFSG